MRTIQLIVLTLLLFFTATAYTQSSDVEDAVQNQRLQQLERNTDRNTEAIIQLAAKLDSVSDSINRFTGIGLGIGATLTVLQAVLIIVTYRGKNGK